MILPPSGGHLIRDGFISARQRRRPADSSRERCNRPPLQRACLCNFQNGWVLVKRRVGGGGDRSAGSSRLVVGNEVGREKARENGLRRGGWCVCVCMWSVVRRVFRHHLMRCERDDSRVGAFPRFFALVGDAERRRFRGGGGGGGSIREERCTNESPEVGRRDSPSSRPSLSLSLSPSPLPPFAAPPPASPCPLLSPIVVPLQRPQHTTDNVPQARWNVGTTTARATRRDISRLEGSFPSARATTRDRSDAQYNEVIPRRCGGIFFDKLISQSFGWCGTRSGSRSWEETRAPAVAPASDGVAGNVRRNVRKGNGPVCVCVTCFSKFKSIYPLK